LIPLLAPSMRTIIITYPHELMILRMCLIRVEFFKFELFESIVKDKI